MLADGTAFSVSSTIVGKGAGGWKAQFYDHALYRKKGAVVGSVTFREGANGDCDGSFQWSRPPLALRNSPGGFGTSLNVVGAHYTPRILGGATLDILGSSLETPISGAVNFTPTNFIAGSGLQSAVLKMSYNVKNGIFSGAVTPGPKSPKLHVGGVFYQGSSTRYGGGFYRGLGQNRAMAIGSVDLRK